MAIPFHAIAWDGEKLKSAKSLRNIHNIKHSAKLSIRSRDAAVDMVSFKSVYARENKKSELMLMRRATASV